MAGLEDTRADVAARRDELRFLLFDEITREEELRPAVRDAIDVRHLVARAAVFRRGRGEQHLHLDAVDRHGLPLSRRMEFLQERAGIAEAHAARIGSRALARRVDRADGQLLQDAAAALRVVLMRMRQKDGRDLADPMMQQIWHGNPRADIETALARATRVKEQRPARWRHDERGIALPHIDEVDGEAIRRDCTVKRDGSRQHEEQCERRPTPGRRAG